MRKKTAKNFVKLFILVVLLGLIATKALIVDDIKQNELIPVPITSDLPRVIYGNNGTLLYNGTDLRSAQPQICSDESGGFIVTWAEQRDGATYGDIYAQRIDRYGNPLWGENGVAVCTAEYTQTTPRILSDGNGGAIIAWHDYRFFNIVTDIYAQRVSLHGTLTWEDNGTLICNAIHDQRDIRMVTDGGGTSNGAIIAWTDERNGDKDIYAQKISYLGVTQWTDNGTAICTQSDFQYTPQIVSDGSGGAIMAWTDARPGLSDNDIYAQRVDSDGNPLWTSNGKIVCNADDGQYDPSIVSDGNNGAIITWHDQRIGGVSDIYAQRINNSGDAYWTNNGITICNETDHQQNPNICSDGSSGAIITWSDSRNGNHDVYAQKVNSNGINQWETNGTAICTQEDYQMADNIIRVVSGGAIICWTDDRNGDSDIYAQWVYSNGEVAWSKNGTAICIKTGIQSYLNAGPNTYGGANIIWVDGPEDDIYFQLLDNDDNPTSNHPGDIITTKEGSEDITWEMYDDYGEGQFRVLANNSIGNMYVWKDWDSWSSGSPYPILINRSMPGDFMYILEFYDVLNQFGQSDEVIVTVTNNIPTSNNPTSIITSAGGTETINWTLFDDFGGGQYRVMANNSIGNMYVWSDWTSWLNNTPLNVPINRSAPGEYEYTIEYNDNVIEYGISDIVFVTINDAIPTSNHPDDDIIEEDVSKTIDWVLNDDFGEGQYRVLVNGTAGTWIAWTSGVHIYHAVDTSTAGIFNYTIQFQDSYGNFGVSDTVIITVEESEDPEDPEDPPNGNPTVPGYNMIFVIITIISIIAFFTRKRVNKLGL